MVITTTIVNLFLAIFLGAAIGLERESRNQKEDSTPGGIRTYSLVSLLGALCGLLYADNLIVLGSIVTISFFLMLLIYYAVGSYTSKDFGMTTELSIFFTFLLGLLPTMNILPTEVVIALFVILALILSIKAKTKKIVQSTNLHEIESFISYAIIALVVLPFLPNVGYKLVDIPFLSSIFQGLNIDLGKFATLELINPYKIWMVVALITGIDVFGYIMAKVVGSKNSFTLASFVAGFISSTSTTQSLAQRSKKTSAANHLVGAAVLANLASFLQIFVLVGPLNGKWLVALFPSLIIMLISATILAVFFLRQKEKDTNIESDEKKKQEIFSLMPALKFAGLLIVVKIVTKICLILFGQSGFVISSVIASFAGIDAIVVNLAEMAGQTLTLKFAALTFLIVSATNLASKSLYSFLQGNKKFATRFLGSMVVITACSFVGLLFI
jgi:uncharacterized membrane protein (DUF4010 family)